MKAALRHRYCSPDKIVVSDIPQPNLRHDEILIKVKATTVNRTDCAILTAKPFIMRFFIGLFRPKRSTLGTDFAGSVTAIGKTVTLYRVDDRVFGFDDMGLSSQAEYLVVRENAAVGRIPDGVNFDQAAASLEAAHYAFNFLNKVELKAGQKVLVNGASGGIGSALVQFLVVMGVDVTAVCGTAQLELARSIGATHVIDYLKDDFTECTLTFDFVFDAVGKSTFGKCKKLLNAKGSYISSELGPGGQNIFLPLLTFLFRGKRVKFPVPTNIPRSINYIAELLTNGKFRPVIDRTYPLEDIAKAYAYVMSGQKIGNVVITI